MKPLKTKMRKGFTLVELLVVISIIATLAGVGVPVIIGKLKEGARAEALQNAHQVGLAMFTFDQDFGSFPCDVTAIEVKNQNPDTVQSFGNSYSNDYFRQLIAAEVLTSEESFYAKAPYTRKPDNIKSRGKCLEGGECGFGYIMATPTEPLSSAGDSRQPLIVAVLNDAQTNGTFDPNVYAKRAVVLRLDQSARSENIRTSDKKVTVGGGKTLLQGGDRDTVWGTDIHPVLKAPQKMTAGVSSELKNDDNTGELGD